MNIYYARMNPQGDEIEYIVPSTDVIALTGQPPHGFDGGYIHHKPEFPAILITSLGLLRHVPNTLVSNEEELEAWRVKFWSNKIWVYEIAAIGCSQAEEDMVMARNQAHMST